MIAAHVLDGLSRMARTSAVEPIVYVVDGDAAARDSLEGLARLEGWRVETFASAEAFLSRPRVPGPSCLVLDATLPRCGGLEVQRRLAVERPDLPIIFTTDRGDVAVTVAAMKAGAAEFLMKPLDEARLTGAIRHAMVHSRAMLDREAAQQALQGRYADLSQRERQVMALVASGLLNKQVGGELGISEVTVKAHRGQVMRKMRAGSLVDLVHMADRLGLTEDRMDGPSTTIQPAAPSDERWTPYSGLIARPERSGAERPDWR
jgi:FixJ family two-component response regulator